MALSSGTVAASATPATDLMALINTALLAAGWVEEVTRTYTASIMGTTANCRVYTSAATTVASSIYTGCILSFEVDDTNARIRVRACEKFDSSLSGAAALNTKWGVYGGGSATTQTPTANYALSDSFIAHFQATGTGSTNAWVEVPCPATGFNYWLGANASRFITFNNASGLWHVAYAGQLAYQGDLLTAVGNACVFLGAGNNALSTGDGSWTLSGTTQTANFRTSREPNAVGASGTLGTWWCCSIDGPQVATQGAAATTNANPYGGPGVGNHHFYQATFVVFPAWLHGVTATTAFSGGAGRSNFATLPESVVLLRLDRPSGTFGNRADGPNIGELVTVGGTTYTCAGIVQAPGSGYTCQAFLLVDGSQF